MGSVQGIKNGKIVFLGAHFLFTCSDTSAIGCIVQPQYTATQTNKADVQQYDRLKICIYQNSVAHAVLGAATFTYISGTFIRSFHHKLVILAKLRREKRLKKLHLRATECHLPYGITQCYLTQVNTPRNNPSHRPVGLLDLPTPEGQKAELTQLVGYLSRLFTRPQTVTHPSRPTNAAVHGRESNLQPVDHKKI